MTLIRTVVVQVGYIKPDGSQGVARAYVAENVSAPTLQHLRALAEAVANADAHYKKGWPRR